MGACPSANKSPAQAPESPAEPAADWTCPKCEALVFGSKSACFKCRTTKPKERKRKKRQSTGGSSSTKFAHEPIMQLAGANAPSAAGTPTAAVAPSCQGDERHGSSSPAAGPSMPDTAIGDTPVPSAAAQDGVESLVPAPARRSPSKQKLLFSKSPAVQHAGPSTPNSAQRAFKATDTEFAAVWPVLSKSDRLEALSRLSQVLARRVARACA